MKAVIIFEMDGENREREMWETGVVGCLLGLFEDPGISALAGLA